MSDLSYIEDRPEQRLLIDELARRSVETGFSRWILQGETGFGKSVCALEALDRAAKKGKRTLFVARGRNLVNQFSKKHMTKAGIHHGIIMSGTEGTFADHHVCSKDTLQSWWKKGKLEWMNPDLIVIDEAHEAVGFQRVIRDRFPKAFMVGLTATPILKNGDPLGDPYQGMVKAPPTSKLIEMGRIVPVRLKAPYVPDLSDWKGKGEYSEKYLEKKLDTAALVGDAVAQWKKYGEDKQTVVFCISKQHALHVLDSYRQAGIHALLINDGTPQGERDDIIGMMSDGTARVLVSIMTVFTGFDCPPLAVAQVLRPCKSLRLWRQGPGRVRRRYTDFWGFEKEYCIVLDHAGALFEHGHPDRDIDWRMGNTNIQEAAKLELQEREELMPEICPKCFTGYVGKFCPECGIPSKRKPKSKDILMRNGELVHYDMAVQMQRDFNEKQNYWLRCIGSAKKKGLTYRIAEKMYRSKFQSEPDSDFKFTIKDYSQRDKKVSEVFPKFGKRKDEVLQ